MLLSRSKERIHIDEWEYWNSDNLSPMFPQALMRLFSTINDLPDGEAIEKAANLVRCT